MKWLLLSLSLLSTSVPAETTIFKCSYTDYSSPEGFEKLKKQFELTFLLDLEKGTAYVMGNQGGEEVTVVANATGGLTFIEVTGAGSVQVTAMGKSGKSVHSRNTIIDGEIMPSQYYGKCE